MSSRIGGTVAAFLLSVPVSAAGLVFVLPYLNQVINSPQAEQVIRDPEALDMFRDMVRGQDTSGDAPAFSETTLGQSASPWEEFPSDRNIQHSPAVDHNQNVQVGVNQAAHWSQQAAQQEPVNHADWRNDGIRIAPMTASPPPQQMQQQQTQHPRSMLGDSAFGTNISQSAQPPNVNVVSPVGMSQNSSLSWQDATRQLTELGIQDYHLERGHSDGSFLFVCLFSPGDSPNVKHRFESEASDPLLAVNQVMQQINNWLGERYATNRYSSPGRTSL